MITSLKLRLFYIFFFLFSANFITQGQNLVKWIISDFDKNPLMGASILAESKVLITDQNGQAESIFESQKIIYRVTHVGFEAYDDTVTVNQSLIISVRLDLSDQVMDEVIVASQTSKDELANLSTGYSQFAIESISDLPYLMGEQDPIKFIQTQPGVSTGTEGSNGYYVRGGGIDQNKISLDRIELYNTNHLFGFFSMFNADAIDRVDYYKSGYPGQLGGRLSSTMELHTLNPNLDKFKGCAQIGLIAAGFTIDVPVVEEKSGAIISVRRSYLDLITQNFLDENSPLRRRSDYRFSDFIFKYYQKIGAKHIISLTGFGGEDDYFYKSTSFFSNTINWKTYNAGVNWKWLISPDFDMETYFNVGTYDQKFGGNLSLYEMNLRSDIFSWKAGSLINYVRGKYQWAFGLESIYRKIKPNQASLTLNEEIFTLTKSVTIPSIESAISADAQINLRPDLILGVGLRLSGYLQMGPFDRFNTSDEGAVLDTLSYATNEVVTHYLNGEPRIRLNYLLNEYSSVRFSYDRSNQYIHLSPLSSVSLPTDIWVPSSEKIKPQYADQLTIGYHQLITESNLRFSSAIYYKNMGNQVEYRNGAIVGYSSDANYDDTFIFGKGRSYGLEFSVLRDKGILQYQINYTLSRTEKSFREVNEEVYFPAKYDRTHDVNIISSYKLVNWTFSGLFKLSTGNALTLPTAKYLINGQVISEYSKRNAFRMPTYNRLDLAATLTPKKNKNSTWIFSVYNIYNRSNPYYVYFDVRGDANEYSLDIKLKKVSLFPVLPSISYEFRF